MSLVFISYSQQSEPSAAAIAEALTVRGFDVWRDTNLRSGQQFDNVIRQKLEEAAAVVVIWTPESASSQYVKMEAGIAFAWEKLVTVRTPEFDPTNIPDPFRGMHTEVATDLDAIVAALDEYGVVAKGKTQRKRLTMDELRTALAKVDPLLPAKLDAWLRHCQAAGFRGVLNRSLIIKASVPTIPDVNFATIFPDGTLQTNYISGSSENIGDPSIAADYLKGLAALIPDADVRRKGTPWNWRVNVFDALPSLSSALSRGDEWLELMQSARRRFVEVGQARQLAMKA